MAERMDSRCAGEQNGICRSAGQAVRVRWSKRNRAGDRTMNVSRTLATVLFAFIAVGAALAEPIKVIVPTAPGGGTDGFFRVVVKQAAPYFSDPIVVITAPGAGGT